MQVKVYEQPDAFYERVEAFLLKREADHCVPIGLCSVMMTTPDVYPDPYLAAVEDGETIVAALVMTPPYDPFLSQVDHPDAVRVLMDALAARFRSLGGVVGPVGVVDAFVELWKAKTGQAYRIDIRERLFKLETVNSAAGAGVPGHIRRATADDRDLLVRWRHAFNLEALRVDDLPGVEKIVERGLNAPTALRGTYLWEDAGQVVSLAGYTGTTLNGIRVAPVYTPPEFRGRGYASACVAHMSQILLDEGRRYCFLFTDLSNPTSNHIYQLIGYQPVCDVDKYVFEPMPES
jgi:hypothetical protein